ncbi:MAG TPA: glutathione S-transferase family protein [Gammaproteobacteria bacterium]|nr:glutathione S-transferase family protein [Gammaproteobacteria bacterium]
MKLYDYSTAPSPRKVRFFVAEKGLTIPTVEIDLRAQAQQAPEFLAKNPGGTVPVLELDDGTCLTETLAICRYLEGVHPEPNLLGVDPKEAALVLMWHDIVTLEGYLGLQEALRNGHPAFKGRALGGPKPYEQIPALAERGKQRAAAFFDRLDAHLGAQRYVASNRFTYADIVAYVTLEFAPRATRSNPTEGRPALARWRDEIKARPAIAAAA